LTAATEARGLAYRALRRIESGKATPAEALGARDAHALDPRERDFLHELVLGTLRRRGVIDHALARLVERPLSEVDPDLLTVLRLGAHQVLDLRVPPHAAVSQTVELARLRAPRGAGFVNAVLRRLVREGAPPFPDPGHEPLRWLTSAGSLPGWLAQRWLDRLGPEGARARAEAFGETPAVVFRLNPRRASGAALAAADVVASATSVPGALRLESGRLQPLADAGLVYVQDASSQVVARLAARPGRVLDACAAPGGKSLLLADLDASALVVACEASRGRARTLESLVRRWGATNVACVRADAARPPFARPFDAVLLDAPCSGLGTIGRNPDIRWRARPEELARHAARQRALLAAVAPLVREGGRLVYSVCSLEPEEGRDVVSDFLGEHPDFRPAPAPDWAQPFADGPFLATRPETGGGDGFFVAALDRG
jgi:16S rRNA (cytosine967-C5)-methyltransferase